MHYCMDRGFDFVLTSWDPPAADSTAAELPKVDYISFDSSFAFPSPVLHTLTLLSVGLLLVTFYYYNANVLLEAQDGFAVADTIQSFPIPSSLYRSLRHLPSSSPSLFGWSCHGAPSWSRLTMQILIRKATFCIFIKCDSAIEDKNRIQTAVTREW